MLVLPERRALALGRLQEPRVRQVLGWEQPPALLGRQAR